MPGNTLYIVVPCYNEEEVLPETARRLGDKLRGLMAAGKIGPDSRILFVNDGSRDGTWAVIQRLHREDGLFCGADLSRNRGHQNALLAGLMTAKDKADLVISMDADLQDDVALQYSSLAQLVEHAAVNRRVVGSSPTGGAILTRMPPLPQVAAYVNQKVTGVGL